MKVLQTWKLDPPVTASVDASELAFWKLVEPTDPNAVNSPFSKGSTFSARSMALRVHSHVWMSTPRLFVVFE